MFFDVIPLLFEALLTTFSLIARAVFLTKITESISYLHNMEHMLHMNVCPSSVFVTHRGVWKLAGLGFAERPVDGICQVSIIIKQVAFAR